MALGQQAVPMSEVLAVFAACDQLTDWRDGKVDDPGDTADYQVPSLTKTLSFSAPKIIPAICTNLSQSGSAIVKGAEDQALKNFNSIQAFAGKVQLNSQEMYGVLHEDETGCYAGMVQKSQIHNKAETLFVVVAITVVKGKVLNFYHGGRLTNPSTIARLLDTSRATIAATLARN